jgi:hypothetical protein
MLNVNKLLCLCMVELFCVYLNYHKMNTSLQTTRKSKQPKEQEQQEHSTHSNLTRMKNKITTITTATRIRTDTTEGAYHRIF